jgi:DNA-binding LacI/PurR family transcriptional regulator
MEIARQHNYVYNAAAADLSKPHARLIGVLIPTANKSVFAETLIAIQEKTQENVFSLIIGNTRYDQALEKELVQNFQERRVAGIIFTGFTFGQEKLIRQLMDQGISCVTIWEKLEDSDLNYVGFDNLKAACSATDYLVKLGHRRIGLIVGPYKKVGRVNKRLLGYQKALKENDIDFDPTLVVATEPDLMEGRQAMRQLLSLQNRPTAVFAASDRLAIGGLLAIKQAGLTVPQDMSLVGFDDVEFAAYCDPPLTTIRVPAREMGYLAVRELLNCIKSPAGAARQYCLDTDLVIRDSCSTPSRSSTPVEPNG